MRILYCDACGRQFVAADDETYLCSEFCREQKQTYEPLNPSKTGAANELLVTLDLMRYGFEVFRAVSPSSAFDLVAYKPPKLIRVEVTTGVRTIKGLSYPKHIATNFDLIAVVIGGQNIVYLDQRGAVMLPPDWGV